MGPTYPRTVFLILSAICAPIAFLLGAPSGADAQERVVLRVALYPYVPDGRALFYELEASFEAAHPEVNLELVENYTDEETGETRPLSWYYYSGGLLQTEADVYEIDTVLLADMVEAGKLAMVSLPERAFRDEALRAVTIDGEIWAVPHWVCGNFLFYHADDDGIRGVTTWDELVRVFEEDGGNLFVDLKGTSTLGEWYLTALVAESESSTSVLRVLQNPELDDSAVDLLRSLLDHCPSGYCRREDYHDRLGFYARMFARGRARAYIGYSETAFYALSEIAQSCSDTDGCLRPGDIAVREIPPVEVDGGRQIGWVDALGLDASLSAEKRRLAEAFVEFATSWAAYRLILEPEWPDPPRYLLPAVEPLSGAEPLSGPLYDDFYSAYGTRLILTAEGINAALRGKGTLLDCVLPGEKDDDCNP